MVLGARLARCSCVLWQCAIKVKKGHFVLPPITYVHDMASSGGRPLSPSSPQPVPPTNYCAMATALPEGCWPTMITPYNAEGQIDYPLLKALIGTPRPVCSPLRDSSTARHRMLAQLMGRSSSRAARRRVVHRIGLLGPVRRLPVQRDVLSLGGGAP